VTGAGIPGAVDEDRYPTDPNSKMAMRVCRINESEAEQFNEGELMRSLEVDIKKQIESINGTVASVDKLDKGFSIRYRYRQIQGEISMYGRRQGLDYLLMSQIDEKTRE
jgi:hypothetical protein